MGRKEPEAVCVYCDAKIAKPLALSEDASPDAVHGGRCPRCNSLFLLDATGRAGGQAILDGLTLLADGDQDRGLSLKADVDYKVKGAAYNPRTHSMDSKSNVRRYGVPKLWFFKLLGE